MAWGQVANIRGPQGEQGIQGAKGDKGDQGDPGVPGQDGAGIEIAGSVTTYANLPTGLTAADSGDGYLVEADGKLYIWDGSSFPSNGSGVEFRGPQGPKGDKGDKGDTGDQGIQGIQGIQGNPGGQGDPGARGSLWYTGSGAPGVIAGSTAGDLYLDTASGAIYKLS